MQVNVTFNTHEAVKALKSTGFNEKQAESVVETINKAVNETVATKADLALLAAKMATKDDIKDMATKDDLKGLATKDELKALATKDELKALATKDDIKDMATKDDIKDMATKADLEVMATKIETLGKTVEGIQENIDKKMATKADIKAEIGNLESRMMRMMLLQTLVLVSTFGALIFTAVKLL